MLDLTHERRGSSSDPSINGHFHYPNDVDRPLNETVVDKIRKYYSEYNNSPFNAISFIPVITSTSGRLHSEFVCLLFLQAHRETDRLFWNSRSSASTIKQWTLKLSDSVFSSHLKSKIVNILAKVVALRITLNIDGVPLASRSHTHPSHSQTSRLLTSSLSFGVPVPHATQCRRVV